ncbi:serine/threonine-protein kinase [Clostridium perfringens]|uniref:serine/threonine-protein kinase n=1 Tax=Clostridium perfringens TaxID=1502 RepID=UPI0018E49707|nr:serine/threonine-protein kinase [Clostridium perfringens]MBI6038176.1 serine/threonine protein kinase [Clostridium perfringens]
MKDDKNILDTSEIETEYIDNSKEKDFDNDETEYLGEDTVFLDTSTTEYIDDDLKQNDRFTVLNHRYKLVEKIGEGGMGFVYKAEDLRLRGYVVAIKEIKLDSIAKNRREKVIQNFENEAGILIKLRHNAIPRVLDFFCLNNDKCYIVMDFIYGQTLEDVILSRGKIPEKEVKEWFYQIADVIKYLHSREPKIIFRDLKPSNVMLTSDNEIKLIDFGIARTFKDEKSSDTTYYVSQGFSPPEQYGTGQSDERSDIYSLGALMYSLLIGGKPKINDFKFESLKGQIEISDSFNYAIMKATEFRLQDRPATIDEFVELVNRNSNKTIPLESENIHKNKIKNEANNKINKDISLETKKIKKGKNNTLLGIGVLVLLIFLGIGVWYFFSEYKLNDESSNNIINNRQNESSIKVNNNVDNDKNSNNKDNDLGKESINNTINDNKINNNEINKAIDILYKTTGVDKNITKFEYNFDDGYINDPKIKEKYFIFSKCDRETDNMDDKSYLVNKKDYSVYVWPAGTMLMPYDIYSNEESQLHKYLFNFRYPADEENKNSASVKYFEQYGAEAFLKKVKEIISNANESTLNYYGYNYVDYILEGNKKEELDKHINNRMVVTPFLQQAEYEKREVEGRDNFSKDELDYIKSRGEENGKTFASSIENNENITKDKYINEYCPSNSAGPYWKEGFLKGYNEVKNK